jgi:hypothetical protein
MNTVPSHPRRATLRAVPACAALASGSARGAANGLFAAR